MSDNSYPFRWSDPEDPYLGELRAAYALGEVAGEGSDHERARSLTRWVSSRWGHDGSNLPERSDPLSILREAERGRSFRCVEYATVLAGVLCAVGIPARLVTLMTADVETREGGAAHAVTEAFLPDRDAWVMLDAQWGTVPALGGEPVSAAGLRDALIRCGQQGDAGSLPRYLAWVAPHLHYLEAPLDNRIPAAADRDPRRLMLIPPGAPEPHVFQRRWAMEDLLYTRSEADFYPRPAQPG